MPKITVKLKDPTRIFWEDETVLTGKNTVTIERTATVNKAIQEGRLVEVGSEPAPEAPAPQDPAPKAK